MYEQATFFPWTDGTVEKNRQKKFPKSFLKCSENFREKSWHTDGTLGFKKAQLRATDSNTAPKLSDCWIKKNRVGDCWDL
jgi:hypothetical protein